MALFRYPVYLRRQDTIYRCRCAWKILQLWQPSVCLPCSEDVAKIRVLLVNAQIYGIFSPYLLPSSVDRLNRLWARITRPGRVSEIYYLPKENIDVYILSHRRYLQWSGVLEHRSHILWARTSRATFYHSLTMDFRTLIYKNAGCLWLLNAWSGAWIFVTYNIPGFVLRNWTSWKSSC